MLILRIRQAEVALADGRLDEVFAAVMGDGALRAHRRGQAVATDLARQLVGRGREHLAAARLEEARVDAQKAAEVAGNTAAVAALRADLADAMLQLRRQAQQRQALLAEAGVHIDRYRFSVGERLLGELETNDAQPLRNQLDQRQRAVDAAAAAVDEALSRDDWSAAAGRLAAARREGLGGEAIDSRIDRLRQMLLKRIADDFGAGRLHAAQIVLDHLTLLDPLGPRTAPWAKTLTWCRGALNSLRHGRTDQALGTLRRLRTAMPDTPWLCAAVEQCEHAAAAMVDVCTGPLGLLDSAGTAGPDADPGLLGEDLAGRTRIDDVAAGQEGEMSLPPRLLIRVDGVGSFLVLRAPRVTIGPISSSARPDVGLLIDPSTPLVAIERTEEDYFLVPATGANGAPGPQQRRLLADGDRIELTSRCRLRFSRPNAASTSAVLELSSGRLGQADTRKVILMDREVLLGPSSAAHIRAEDATDQAVLLVREGRLVCQTSLPVLINGKPAVSPAALPLSVPVRVGPTSLVVETG